MALAGNQNNIIVSSLCQSIADCLTSVAQTGNVLACRHILQCRKDFVDNQLRILGTRIIGGNNDIVSQLQRQRTHQRTLFVVTVTAASEHNPQLTAGNGARCFQHVLQTVWSMCVVYNNSIRLSCLNKLETIDKGSITIDGEELCRETSGGTEYVKNNDVRRIACKMGMVFQQFNLFPHMTVLENLIEAPVNVQKRDKAEVIKEAEVLLAKVGLSDKRDVYPRKLSGGQQQRVAIARALAMKPAIMLFDEPTSSLDPELTGEVLRAMRELADEKMTMVVVTHEMGFAREVATKVVFMADGHVQEQGSPEEIFINPKNERLKSFLKVILK